MADLIIAEKEDITAIADAIRSKSLTNKKMTLKEMAHVVMGTGLPGVVDIKIEEVSLNG